MALLGLCHCIGFSLVAVSRGYSPVALAHGLSCFVACGIFRDQGSNPPFLYWQADSELLSHQGSLSAWFLSKTKRFHFRFPEFPYNNLLLWDEDLIRKWTHRNNTGWDSTSGESQRCPKECEGPGWSYALNSNTESPVDPLAEFKVLLGMLERRWGRGLCERGLLDHLKGVFEVILYIHYGAPIHVHGQQLGIVFHFLLVLFWSTVQ